MDVSVLDKDSNVDLFHLVQNAQKEMMQILLEVKEEVSSIRHELSILSNERNIHHSSGLDAHSNSRSIGEMVSILVACVIFYSVLKFLVQSIAT